MYYIKDAKNNINIDFYSIRFLRHEIEHIFFQSQKEGYKMIIISLYYKEGGKIIITSCSFNPFFTVCNKAFIQKKQKPMKFNRACAYRK